MNKRHLSKVLSEVPTYSRFLRMREIEEIAAGFGQYSCVEEKVIGKTAENKPLKMYAIGRGEKSALLIGVPHSDEPLGSLVALYFLDWMTKHPELDFFGWRWLIIPVLEQRGMRMNEGWFDNRGSLVATAKSHFREPTENQYEWTFPFKYKNHIWMHPRPESVAVKEILKVEKPDLLCNLHHCGFYDTYFYFSRDLPEAYSRLRKLSENLRLPLSTSNPDVPFGKVLTPGFYQMYGVRDYIDHYAKNEPDNLLTMRRGSSSDEWYQDKIGGFSFNCEVPLLKSSIRKDNGISNQKLRDLLLKRRQKRENTVQYSIDILTKLEPFFSLSNPLILGSVMKHIANAKLELEYNSSKIEAAGNRNSTYFEAFENDLMVDVAELLLLGQIWRVMVSIQGNKPNGQIRNRQVEVDRKITVLANMIQSRGYFMPFSLQRLIKMQLGSILVIADILSNYAQLD